MTLSAILVGTLVAGIGSVWLAALLIFGALGRFTQHMLSLAAGALLSTAFMNILPEAFESGIEPHDLFLVLLVGLVFFFLLDKAELWHHGHEHHHGPQAESANGESPTHHAVSHDGASHHGHDHATHAHSHTHASTPVTGGSWAVLAGDSVHCFGDGVLIAAAFMADVRLGALASLAVLAHEVPHHMGDLMVLRGATSDKRAAIVKVSLAGSVTALGGIVGYWLVDQLHDYLPYFLVVASSSFIYVALADLIPQLQKHLTAQQTAAQIAWLSVGIGLVTLMSSLGGHSH